MTERRLHGLRRSLAGAAVLLAALAVGSPPHAGRAESGAGPLQGLHFEEVRVRLVLLHATVLNRRGHTVGGLGPGDFLVTENGVRQEISVFGTASDQPLKIAFLLDVSGSMSVGGKLARAREAIRSFVSALRPEDQAALLIFADGDVVVALGFTTDRHRFLRVLDQQEAWGKTALRDALAYAPHLLAEARPGRKALVLVTDGVDNASEMSAWEAVRTARQVQVPIYALGLTGLPLDHRERQPAQEEGRSFFDVMQEFARETGGDLFPVFDAAEVAAAVAQVQEQLRGQYVLGYNPDGVAETPGFHRVEVRTASSRYRVKTRTGYYLSD